MHSTRVKPKEYFNEMELTYEKQNLENSTKNSQPVLKKPRFQINYANFSPSRRNSSGNSFSYEDLLSCLFDKNNIRPINIEQPAVTHQKDCFWCNASLVESKFQCPQHKLESLGTKQTNQLPLAIRSLPPEVGLCQSGIPGAGYGVCAKRTIPIGAWIGPYEGKFVKPEEISSAADTSYMWEIYKDGILAGCIDGSDENYSSWMRFIRCARYTGEQNMFAFQYLGKVFYRVFKTIQPGQELLVWYDDKYPQYLGIPSAMFDMGTVIPSGTSSKPNEMIVVTTHVTNQPLDTSPQSSFFPIPPPSPVSHSSSQFGSNPVSLKGNRSPIRKTGDEKLSSPKHESAMKPVSDMKFVFENGYSPLKQNEANAVTEAKQGRPESFELLSLPGDESNVGKKTAAVNIDSKATELSVRTATTFKEMFVSQMAIGTQTPPNPYQCGHCPAYFNNVCKLRAHAVIHVGKKPFKCGYCSRSFTEATTLNNHIRSHVGGRLFTTGKRPLQTEEV